ncbi:MAG: PDZ domain-containing protein [Wenzhouxiangellaceae bacterium]
MNLNPSVYRPRPSRVPARTLAVLASLWLSASVWAQSDDAESSPASKAEMDALREELDQAREQLTEAARRMAEIQRQLGDTQQRSRFVLRRRGDDVENLTEELETVKFHLREELGAMRPRLGVLLGGIGLDDDQDPRTVVGVTPGGGAEAAGIRRGDVIVSINGQAITDSGVTSVREALSGAEPGQSVPVEILRDGETLNLNVELGSPGQDIRMIVRRLGDHGGLTVHGPDMDFDVESVLEIVGDAPVPPIPPVPPASLRFPHLAVLGKDIDLVSNHPGLEPYFGTGEGVLVLRVDDENTFGLRAGDVILTLDREAIGSPVEIGRLLLRRDSGSEITLEVMRDGVLTELSGSVPERKRFGFGPHKRMHWIEAPRAPKSPKAPPVTL